ncbi:hypothetical protein O6P43_020229 [Quillaja saponaria]|uniref:Uncharacterized protein n=1 Tax=Quillaja saponaria TaxID=32244 RepID=A0AAD7PM33_QUISA|nr:hypothetical protein O6P43_020229 [Quillaja saponaria]
MAFMLIKGDRQAFSETKLLFLLKHHYMFIICFPRKQKTIKPVTVIHLCSPLTLRGTSLGFLNGHLFGFALFPFPTSSKIFMLQ